MTAQQKSIFTIVYFLVMLIPSYLSRRWLWAAVCKAGGTTPKELRAKIGKAEEEAGKFFGGEGRSSMSENTLENFAGKNIRSRLFWKNGQKSPPNEGFFGIFFLGSGKNLNKTVCKQMFVKENRG